MSIQEIRNALYKQAMDAMYTLGGVSIISYIYGINENFIEGRTVLDGDFQEEFLISITVGVR